MVMVIYGTLINVVIHNTLALLVKIHLPILQLNLSSTYQLIHQRHSLIISNSPHSTGMTDWPWVPGPFCKRSWKSVIIEPWLT